MNLTESYKTGDLIKLHSGQVIDVQYVYSDYLNGKVISPQRSDDDQLSFGGFPRVQAQDIKHILNESDIEELKAEIEKFIELVPEDAKDYIKDSNSEEFKQGFMDHCKFRLRLNHEVVFNHRRGTASYDAFIFGIETAKKYFEREF